MSLSYTLNLVYLVYVALWCSIERCIALSFCKKKVVFCTVVQQQQRKILDESYYCAFHHTLVTWCATLPASLLPYHSSGQLKHSHKLSHPNDSGVEVSFLHTFFFFNWGDSCLGGLWSRELCQSPFEENFNSFEYDILLIWGASDWTGLFFCSCQKNTSERYKNPYLDAHI